MTDLADNSLSSSSTSSPTSSSFVSSNDDGDSDAKVSNKEDNGSMSNVQCDDFLYEDILGGVLDENDDDLDDMKKGPAAKDQLASSSNKSGSACGNESCAALLSYLRTTIGDRDRVVTDLEEQIEQLKTKHTAEVQKLTNESEQLRKQYNVAKSQAVRLRTELRDWLRLPLNRAIVALKRSANLSSVSQILEVAPNLGSTEVKSDEDMEIAELEQRLKAYHSMLKAKQLETNNESDSRDSVASNGSKTSERLLQSNMELEALLLDDSSLDSTKNKVAAKEEAEVEEGEVFSDDEEKKEGKKAKKKKHESSKSKKKKKSSKEKTRKDKEKHDRKDRDVSSSANTAASSQLLPVRPPKSSQPSGVWIGLLRKHVGGAWPPKKPVSDSKNGDNRPSDDLRYEIRRKSGDKKSDSRYSSQGSGPQRGLTDSPPSSPSNNSSVGVAVESKLVAVSDSLKRHNRGSSDYPANKRSRRDVNDDDEATGDKKKLRQSSRDENHRRSAASATTTSAKQSSRSSESLKKERSPSSPRQRSSGRSFAAQHKGNTNDETAKSRHRHSRSRSRSRGGDRSKRRDHQAANSSSDYHASSSRHRHDVRR